MFSTTSVLGLDFGPPDFNISITTVGPWTEPKRWRDYTPAKPIPRPRNAYMMYRGDFVVQHRGKCSDIGKLSSIVWKTLTEGEQAPWYAVANVEKREHKRRFPSYVFRPRRLGEAKVVVKRERDSRAVKAATGTSALPSPEDHAETMRLPSADEYEPRVLSVEQSDYFQQPGGYTNYAVDGPSNLQYTIPYPLAPTLPMYAPSQNPQTMLYQSYNSEQPYGFSIHTYLSPSQDVADGAVYHFPGQPQYASASASESPFLGSSPQFGNDDIDPQHGFDYSNIDPALLTQQELAVYTTQSYHSAPSMINPDGMQDLTQELAFMSTGEEEGSLFRSGKEESWVFASPFAG